MTSFKNLALVLSGITLLAASFLCFYLYYAFYLSCSMRFGFNEEGRCFDAVETVVYHSESSLWGVFGAATLLGAGVCFFLRRRIGKSF